MTRLPGRLGWLSLGGVVLASTLAFLYARTQDYDESSYFEHVALLRQIQQLDARWELEALKSKVGINTDYDSLARQLIELDRLRERLDTVVLGHDYVAGAAVTEAGAAFRRAIQEKARLVEQFKSHNAVLRNSLEFLATAAADVRTAAGRSRQGDAGVLRQVSEASGQVLLASLEYNQTASNDKAIEIEARLGRLAEAWDKLYPDAAASEALDILASHVRAVVREHDRVDELLGRIAAVPAAARIDDILHLLEGEQQQAMAEAQRYRFCLLGFSALLIGLFLYAAVGLIYSHAVIRRVNGELRVANDSLEQRVEERTRELRAAQSELVATARQAGMAEIATNVLHNVGNVLNSVNVSASLIDSQLRASRFQGLARAVELMNEHTGDLGDFLARDPKGRLLPDYLNKLADAVDKEHRNLIEELGTLTRSIDHIKDIVATQQSYAGNASVVAPVHVRDLLEDALRMQAAALTRHNVTVVKEFGQVPVLPLDKPRVLQILVNLISNAKYAMDGVTDRAHRMTIRADIAEAAGGCRLRICVADEGEGIPAENLTRIFAHGFTTRPNGHGFGLHSCSLAVREMGGTLTAHSDGPGRGAVFTLEIPVREACKDGRGRTACLLEPKR